ncbi:hypothetical protein FHW58_001160 [Duganella sp. 1224]|uniref:hypothetical protein n=1 Tax=Duganella sp. 1224 TaxID=2587052 RepID=UPI0015CABE6A|nr:hypothetical protein [Duganella sp. 1224]NYE60008.1 hypothetical protein [Duganella sp. 1224]
MDTLKDIVEFRSIQFAPLLPDEAQVNPGVYGAELAFWLSTFLAGLGVITSYPQHEDWGWYVDYTTDSGAEFAIHCGNVDGSKDQWLLSLRPIPRKMFGRDKPPFADAAKLIAGIRTAVGALNSASEVVWHWDNANT